MTWGPNWGMPPYGMYNPPNVQYIPVSQSNADNVFKILRHLEKKEEKKKKLEEESKKKEKEKTAPKPISMPLPVVFLLLCTFGLPVGLANYWVLHTLIEAIKISLK